jgi:signal transduction histidine kinase
VTRRIVVVLLVLSVVLVTAVAVPLGVLITSREHVAFRDRTQAAARVVAASAEEYLSDQGSAATMRADLAAAAAAGDCATVYDAAGRAVASTPCTAAQGEAAQELVGETLSGREPEPPETEGRLIAAEPVGGFQNPVGVVVLARSAAPLNADIAATWGWIALSALAGMAASVALALWLARWVSRPLTSLDTSAERLGEGELDVRAPDAGGPPEVRRLTATFNTMAARNEALLHGHQAVVADVSHQLRTPLAAVRLRLDLLGASPAAEDSDTLGLVASAQEETARLSRLVDGLLEVARAEQTVPKPVAVPVSDVVRDRMTAWEPVAEERGIGLATGATTAAQAALGAEHLEQVLDNLLANAFEAVPEGGRVTVDCTEQRDTVRLRVVDDGPGMTEEAKAVAFRRFGNPQAHGTGLGLAIVHRLVTVNGGKVSLEDTPGGGLTVVMELPRWTPRSPEARRTEPNR